MIGKKGDSAVRQGEVEVVTREEVKSNFELLYFETAFADWIIYLPCIQTMF